MKTRFIGDVHAKYVQYLGLIDDFKGDTTIQVGDFGIGFNPERDIFVEKVLKKRLFNYEKNWFIDGNHDNLVKIEKLFPSKFRVFKGGVPRIENDIMFFGGASSIDRLTNPYRVPGVGWWETEQRTMQELETAVELYCDNKPSIVVSHTAPQMMVEKYIAPNLPFVRNGNFEWIGDATINGGCERGTIPRTEKYMQYMIEESGHFPDLWVCGHWHISLDVKHENCNFVVLNELETLDIEI